VTLESFRWVIL